jgi:hypothetical protein
MFPSRSIWLFLPMLAWAQEAPPAPPPEVDQALRARVSEFYQCHVDGTFRKAFELVADESKDFYFANNKTRYLSFKIDKINYSDNFTKARVILTTELIWEIRLQKNLVKRESYSNWKIENGKWYWYNKPEEMQPTPMGKSDPTAITRSADGSIQLPKDLSNPEMLAKVGQNLLNATKLDKTEIVLALDKPSEDKVVLHNGAQGWINVTLDKGPPVPGMSFVLDKSQVGPNQDAMLKVAFQPGTVRPPETVRVRLTIEPFNQILEVTVRVNDPAK